MRPSLDRRIAAEFFGTAFLVAAVVGSGIMAERLSGGNVAMALLVNTIATGAALVTLILTFGPISGAHFNPAVSLADAIEGGLAWRELGGYIGAQTFGGIAGTLAAHTMFGLPLISLSRHVRAGPSQFLSEFIAAFGLLCVIWGCSRSSSSSPMVPFAVASYITAAYWFTASTSFANPAVTIARALSDTFAGIRPRDVPLFVVAQILGAIAATILFRWLVPGLRAKAKSVVFARNEEAETISPSR
jgi:glycerol uptake facilitator-like aquaporin